MPTASPSVSSDPALDAHVFWYKYKGQIMGAIVLALLIIIGSAVYKLYSDRRAAAAANALATAKTAQEYEQVIAQYPKTGASASAAILLADLQRTQGKFAESNATLQALVDKDPKNELVSTAQLGIAVNLGKMGKSDEALARYRQIAKDDPASFAAPLALISEVPILKAKNKLDEARVVYETIINQYPKSFWAMEAMQELRSIKPPAGSSSPSPAQKLPLPAGGPPMRFPAAPPNAPPAPAASRPPQPAPVPSATKP